MSLAPILRIAVALGLWLSTVGVAHAVELSNLKVRSALYQPFFAEIVLKGVKSDFDGVISVALASRSAHRDAGIAFDEALTQLDFAVDPLVDPPKIVITTEGPLNAPFVRFLLDFQVQDQRVYRDYTAMLDPVDLAAQRVPISTPAQLGTNEVYPGERYGPVKKGDTLMRIARSINVSGPVTVKQRMVALLADNPDAFIDGNMNLLKAGATLHVPSERFMMSRTASEAAAVYETQLMGWLHRQPSEKDSPPPTSNWASMDGPKLNAEPDLTGVSTDYVLRIVSPAEQSFSSQATTAASDGTILQAQASGGATGAASGTGATSGSGDSNEQVTALTNRLIAIEETLGSKEVENETLNKQVDLLERQLEKTMKLIELQESQLALAQQQLERMLKAQEAQPPASAVDGQTAVAPSAADSASVASTESAAAPASEQASAGGAPEAASVDTSAQAASEAQAGEAPAAPWVDPGQTLAWLGHYGALIIGTVGTIGSAVISGLGPGGEIMGYDQNIVLAGLGVLLLLLILLVLKRRRASAGDGERRGGRTSRDGGEKQSLFKDRTAGGDGEGKSGASPDSVGPSFITAVETQRGVAVQSDEVDPLTEAEIYVAYGRVAQAEQTLRDAIERTPHRTDMKFKLLEILQNQGKDAEFAELVSALRRTVVPGSPDETRLNDIEQSFVPAQSGAAAANQPAGSAPSATPPPAATGIDADGIDFETSTGSADTSVDQQQEPAADKPGSSPGLDDDGIDFDITPISAAAESGSSGSQPTLEDDLVFEPAGTIEAPEVVAVEGDDNAETQLHLAEAYIDMGDSAAARDILKELVGNEDPAVVKRVIELLGRL